MKNRFVVQMPVESFQPQHPYRLQHLLKYVLTQPVLIACQILPMNPNCIIFRMCWTMLNFEIVVPTPNAKVCSALYLPSLPVPESKSWI